MRKFSKNFILVFFLLIAINKEIRANILDDISDQFMFKPAVTLEYQAPYLTNQDDINNFKKDSIFEQIKNFDNIVLGVNFRLHKYFGINSNWSKFEMQSAGIRGYNVTTKPSLSVQNYNISSLFYVPLIGDHLLETFAEIGIANVNNKLSFINSDGSATVDLQRKNVLLYGAGLQFAPYESDLAFRFSLQKYDLGLAIMSSDVINYRFGVIKYF